MPDRRLTRRGIVKDIVRFPIAVKVGYCSPSHNTTTWRPNPTRRPKGEKACLIHAKGGFRKDGSHSARREFVDVAGVVIHYKQIAGGVKGQRTRCPGSESASRSAGSEFIDAASIRYKQIAGGVKGQPPECPGSESASHSCRSKFIDVAADRHKQIARTVKSQTFRAIQSGGKGA